MSVYHRMAVLNTAIQTHYNNQASVNLPSPFTYTSADGTLQLAFTIDTTEDASTPDLTQENSPITVFEDQDQSSHRTSNSASAVHNMATSTATDQTSQTAFTSASDKLNETSNADAVLPTALSKYEDFRRELLGLRRPVEAVRNFIISPPQQVAASLGRALKPSLACTNEILVAMIDLEKRDDLRFDSLNIDSHQSTAAEDAAHGAHSGMDWQSDTDVAAGADTTTSHAPIAQAAQAAQAAQVAETEEASSAMEVDSDPPKPNLMDTIRKLNTAYAQMVRLVRSIEKLQAWLARLHAGDAVSHDVVQQLRMVRFGDQYDAWLRDTATAWGALGGVFKDADGGDLF